MVDELRLHQAPYRTLSESSRSDDTDDSNRGGSPAFEQQNMSDRRPGKSRKQNIRELREEFDVDPDLYGIRRSERSRKEPSRFKLQSDKRLAIPIQHRVRAISESDSNDDDEGDDSESSSSSNPPGYRNAQPSGRISGRTRGCRVNYKNAFVDASDSENSVETYHVQTSRLDTRNQRSTNATRAQQAMLQKPRGPLIRISGKASERFHPMDEIKHVDTSDAYSYAAHPTHLSDDSTAEDSRPTQTDYTGCDAVDAEVDVIEDVLNHAVRRVGATGNPTTLYNCRIEYDPNEGFDTAKEKGELMYLIKWRSWSHIHSTWETEASLTSPDRGCPVDAMKRLYTYQSSMEDRKTRERLSNRDELDAMVYEDERNELILSEKMEVERIVGHSRDKEQGSFDYLCKWRRLDYRFCTWESGRVIQYLYPDSVAVYKARCESSTLPNPRHEYLRNRPRFIRLLEQPEYIGVSNPDLRMRDYQLKGLNFIAHAWTRGNSVVLADEMGLGKTLQAVSFLSYLFHEHSIYGPFLVVVPLSTICSWQKELETWAPQLNSIIYVGDHISRQFIRENEWSLPSSGGGRRQQMLKFNVCVTTYEILLKDKSWLGQVAWSVLAVDEAHRLKNDSSQLYKALFAFDTNTRLLITGTPLQNSLKELWSLLHFLVPKIFENWEDFELHYSLHGQKDGADSYEAIQNLHRALEPFLLRRVKKDVEQSLPAKTEQILRVEMSKKQSTIYRLILARNYEGLLKVTHGHRTSFINIVMELKKCCNHANLIAPPSDEVCRIDRDTLLREITRGSGKLMLLDKLLQKLKPQGHRVLIFSQMVRMLDIIADYLQLRGWGFQRLDGTVRGELRKQALDHFNSEGSTDFCFLLSTRAGGLGVNLATADTVIIYDSDWNPQNDIQAQARAHRIGQTKQVSVYRLVVKDSVEEKIIESATRKMLLDHLVIQRMESGGSRGAGAKIKAETKSRVLTEILRHGAEGLFKQNDEDVAEVDVDIDDILNRAEMRDGDKDDDPFNPANALLSTFNVVTLDQLEQEDLKPVQIDPSAKQPKGWSEIIPESLRETMKKEQSQDALLDLELGPRQRKQTKTYQAGVDDYESSVSSSEDSEQVTNKRSTAFRFSDKEIRALVRAVKRFARPLERIEAIAAEAELPDRTSLEVRQVVESVLSGCKAAMEFPSEEPSQNKQKGPFYYYGKVAVAAKPLLQSLSHLEILYKALPSKSKEDRLNYELPFNPKFANWPNLWDAKDDVRLLVGVYEHGYDNWEAIKLDPDLGLGSKLLPLSSNERPQASHIRARVDYLLKTLNKFLAKKINDTPSSTAAGKNSRHHCVSSKGSVKNKKSLKGSASIETFSCEEVSRFGGTKLKSAEFVDSEDDEDSTDSDDVMHSTTAAKSSTGLGFKFKKTPSKRSCKSSAVSGEIDDEVPPAKRAKKRQSSAKVTKIDGEPQHFTANREPVSISKAEEEEFHQMRGPLFDKCKQKLHPIKKLFKQLERLENDGIPKGNQFDRVVLGIGEHIRSLLNEITDRDDRHAWRRFYWEFVQNFSEKDASQLQTVYRHARKEASKHPRDTSRDHKEHLHDRHFKHSDSQVADQSHNSSHHLNKQKHCRDPLSNGTSKPSVSIMNGDSCHSSNHRHRSSGAHRNSSGRYGNSVSHRHSPSGRAVGGGNAADWSSSRRSLHNNSSYERSRHMSRDDRTSGTSDNYNNDRYNNAFNRPAHGYSSSYNQNSKTSRPSRESGSSIPPPCQPQRQSSSSWLPQHSAPVATTPTGPMPSATISIIPPPLSTGTVHHSPPMSRLPTTSIGRDPRLQSSSNRY